MSPNWEILRFELVEIVNNNCGIFNLCMTINCYTGYCSSGNTIHQLFIDHHIINETEIRYIVNI